MNEQSVRQAITPLRMIFWGGLLCIFDITFSQTTNGQGFKCDILDDTLGAILITVGVFKLSAIAVPGRYATVMGFVRIVSVLAVLNTIRAHFIMPLPPLAGISPDCAQGRFELPSLPIRTHLVVWASEN
jgi:hypothetical protein